MGLSFVNDIRLKRIIAIPASLSVVVGSPTVEKFAKLPVWAFHGDKDTAVPVERSRMMIEALKKAGGEPKYTEYPGVGHDSWSATFANPELYDWLFTQLRREEIDSKDLKN